MKIHQRHNNSLSAGKSGKKKLNLRISGFSKQKIVEVDEIIAALDQLPYNHLTGLREIAYDPNRLVQRAIGYYNTPDMSYSVPDFNSYGDYFHDEQWINVYKFKSKSEFFHLLYHEIGHFVYHCVISNAHRRYWVIDLYPRSTYISPYASKNASEDFAESYATYLTKPEQIKRLSRKYHFLKEIVFKY